MNLIEIENLTKQFADARGELADAVTALNDTIEAAKRAALPKIKRLVSATAARHAHLQDAITGNAELFDRPRTHIFHGVKVGFRKSTGGIDWADDARTVELIRKNFSKSQADLLIKTTENPIAKALQDLDVADLRKIGCTVESTGDVVVIKPTDSAVDRIVTALLKDAVEEAQA